MNPVINWRVALDEDFHVHSTFSDGASTLAENVAAAGSDSHHCRDIGVYHSVRQTGSAARV